MTDTQPPFYGPDGSLISQDDAYDMMLDWKTRRVKVSALALFGRKVFVLTTFLPIDQNPDTWGTITDSPFLWVTEVLGGPDDLNGINESWPSLAEAHDGHDLVVERCVASGCELL